MPTWTRARERKCIRNSDGTFRDWRGGDGKRDDRDSSFRGMHIHTAADFKRQNGRAAEVGDVVRHKNRDGSYHEQAMWYVKTEHGWRRSPTEQRKPTEAEIRRVNERSRRGGRRR